MICLEGLRKTRRNHSRYSLCLAENELVLRLKCVELYLYSPILLNDKSREVKMSLPLTN
jgi:hypothetical protein